MESIWHPLVILSETGNSNQMLWLKNKTALNLCFYNTEWETMLKVLIPIT